MAASLSAPARLARSLRDAPARRETGLLLAEGPAVVEAALLAGFARDLFVAESRLERHQTLVDRARDGGVATHVVSDAVLDRICSTRTPQGVCVTCESPVQAYSSERLQSSKHQSPLWAPVVVVAVEVADPGNLGTLIRAADAAGAAVVICVGGADPTNPKVVRSTAGSVFTVALLSADEPMPVVSALRDEWRAAILATTGSGTADLFGNECAKILAGSAPVAWLLGNEARGLPESLIVEADLAVRIPLIGTAESLNVSMAATACLYESLRHRLTSNTAN